MFEKMEIFDCVFTIESNGNIQKQKMRAPRFIIEQQFLQLVQQAAQSNSPTKIKLSRDYRVHDLFNDKMIDRENFIVFTNNAHGDYEEQV